MEGSLISVIYAQGKWTWRGKQGTQGHCREQPGWHSRGVTVHVAFPWEPQIRDSTEAGHFVTYSTSGDSFPLWSIPHTQEVLVPWVVARAHWKTVFLWRAKPVAFTSSRNYHL